MYVRVSGKPLTYIFNAQVQFSKGKRWEKLRRMRLISLILIGALAALEKGRADQTPQICPGCHGGGYTPPVPLWLFPLLQGQKPLDGRDGAEEGVAVDGLDGDGDDSGADGFDDVGDGGEVRGGEGAAARAGDLGAVDRQCGRGGGEAGDGCWVVRRERGGGDVRLAGGEGDQEGRE